MAKITNMQLVAEFKKAIDNGYGYVWGKNGTLYTKEEAERLTREGAGVPDGRDKATYFIKDCAPWYGRIVADCSGGIVGAIRKYDPKFGDKGSDAFRESFTEYGPVKDIPEIPGLLLWRDGHIGVYAGGGIMYEYRGTNYGAVATVLSARKMTLWGKSSFVEYLAEPVLSFPRQLEVKTISGTLNLRALPVDGAILVKLPKGAQVWAIEDNGDEWIEVIYFSNGRYWQGWAFAGYLG